VLGSLAGSGRSAAKAWPAATIDNSNATNTRFIGSPEFTVHPDRIAFTGVKLLLTGNSRNQSVV
jgi:hypothetical protein